MNRIDRLFGITTRLQARGHLRAADLASIYEVSIRTIYRDIAALSESGGLLQRVSRVAGIRSSMATSCPLSSSRQAKRRH